MYILKELESLSSDGIYTMSKIEWWLLKYGDDYRTIKELESNKFCHKIDGKIVRLPPIGNLSSEEEKFLNIYDVLNTISTYHRNENYFKQEMAIYKEIENDSLKVLQWLKKNEKFGAEEYVCFSLDYFEEQDEMENKINLQLYFLEDKERVVFVDRRDFINTIKFTNTFNKIYWELLEVFKLEKLN